MDAPSNALAALSTDLASVVASAARSVAYVDAHPRRDASGIVWDDRHVVTVAHAIDRDDDIELRLGDGTCARAFLVGIDRATDVAVVRAETPLPPPLARAPHADVAIGNVVLAIARDEDGAMGASFGIVGSLGGPWQTWRGGKIERFIRPDLNVYPAFSGGPLVDANGRAIGMNTRGLSRRHAVTLPLETVARVADEIVAHGRVARGYLGLAMQPVRLPESLRAAHGIEQRAGAIVVDVAADGPAERGDAMIGDVLLAIGDRSVEDSDDVQLALAAIGAGNACSLTVVRASRIRTLEVTLGERPRDGE